VSGRGSSPHHQSSGLYSIVYQKNPEKPKTPIWWVLNLEPISEIENDDVDDVEKAKIEPSDGRASTLSDERCDTSDCDEPQCRRTSRVFVSRSPALCD
jgi:hypothetical protein